MFPFLYGKADNKLKNIYFSNCSFEKLPADALPNQDQHGAAAWSRPPHLSHCDWITNAENVVLNNVSCTG